MSVLPIQECVDVPQPVLPTGSVVLMHGITVNALRELFRNLQAFRAFFESEHQDTITDSHGREWCLWDIEYLFEKRLWLSSRQCQAIEMCLYRNMTEENAAVAMGVSPTNPVAMYATDGLRKIIAWIDSGDLPRYREGAS